MANNEIPKKKARVFTLAERMAGGCNKLETVLGIKQNTEAVMVAAIANARTVESDYGDAKSGKGTAAQTMSLTDQDTRVFLKSARAVLVRRYGEDYTAAWEATGFPNQSNRVPRTQAERMDLCASLKTYFTRNPTHENAGMEVTAALAQTHFAAMKAALDGVATGATEAGQAKAARDLALEALKTRMRGLIGELATLLGEDDPRWHTFGLNMPGEEPLPEVPENLVLTPGLPGKVLADWGDARNADHYRVWVKVAGVDADFRHVISRDESDGTIPDLPSGATVQVRITSVNEEGDESLPGEVKEVVVP